MKISILAFILVLQSSVNAHDKITDPKAFFHERGYLWIKEFFTEEQAERFQNWADEINDASQVVLKSQEISSDSLIVVPEAKNPLQVCRAEDLSTIYPDLYTLVTEVVTAYISQTLGEPYVLFKDKINFKWPGGGAFTPHQDFPAYENFGPREHVTVMISVDPATHENGCLQVADNWRGGKTVLPYIKGGASHGSIDPTEGEKLSWLPLETSPRDLVLINSYIPHYSEVNKSQKPRRAYFFTHNRLEEGSHREAYYLAKRSDPRNPTFHFATPTDARDK